MTKAFMFMLALLVTGAASSMVASTASAEYEFEISRFGGALVDNQGRQVTQAASHPNLVNELQLSENMDGEPMGSLRDATVELPAGLILDPSAVDSCTQADLAGAGTEGFQALCSGSAQVGTLKVRFNQGGLAFEQVVPIYNIKTGPDELPSFGANIATVIINFKAEVRTGGDYGITAKVIDAGQTILISGSTVTLWGVPADAAHDGERTCIVNGSPALGCASAKPRSPLVSHPSNCAVPLLRTVAFVSTWENPEVRTASFDHDLSGNPFVVTGCDSVNFEPDLHVEPTTRAAGQPTGLSATLRIPQNQDPDGLSAALLKRVYLSLPEGMTVNAASADGQVGCSLDQVRLGDASKPNCPAAAKIGSVEIETPLLDYPFEGGVYLAEQGNNPFGSLLALYVVAEGSGVTIKLAGRITADPNSGRLTATFDNNPQLPFETLRMELKGGSRAPLVTPANCGTYSSHAELTSWARPDEVVSSDSSFTIDQGCGKDSQFNPGFEAGTTNPQGGGFSPFVLRITRNDAEQNVSRIEATLPEGVLAKLAGVPLCPEQSAGSGSCPAASQIGSATVGVGAGSNPLYVPQPGKAATAVYLAGPYKGAPYSLVAKVPAQAGPFDLGTVAVRNAVSIDPETAQVSVKSDPLPQILQGIPIAYRDIRVNVDRPEFTINPTSCDPMEVKGTIGSANGKSANVSDRFQVANCERLGFKPKLSLKLSGAPTRRGGYPKLRAELKMPKGGANIQRAQVLLPKTELLENAHIRTICTRVQYVAQGGGGKACPSASIYGYAKAWSPLLDKPLEGPVYLRSSSHQLPDLVASLDGQIHIDLVGRIDAKNARIRNTFESVPDAPVSKFVLTMQGGKKGLLANNTDLCKTTPRADATFLAQNGKEVQLSPVAKVKCGKKGR